MAWAPTKMRNGAVVQAGLNAKHRGTNASPMDPTKRPFRAIVLATRVIGEEGQVRNLSVECDVLLVRTQVVIHNVPVTQQQHGVNNVHTIWVPRPTTRTLNDTVLNLDRQVSRRGTVNPNPPTPLDQIDGDMVLLDFIEGDLNWPVITSALTHERTNRLLRAGIGWREGSTAERGSPRKDEYYVHHYGCEIRINEQGELLIDTVGAYSDPATEAASAGVGQVRLRIKDTQRFTVAMGDDEDVLEVWKDGNQVRVDLGSAADQRIPLGDDQVSALSDLFDAFADFAQTLSLSTPTATDLALPHATVLAAYGTLAPLVVAGKTSLEAALSNLARTKRS